MTRSRPFFSIMLFLATSFCLVLHALVAPVVELAVSTFRVVKSVALSALKLSVAKDDGKSAAVVAFIRAKDFILRIIRFARQR